MTVTPKPKPAPKAPPPPPPPKRGALASFLTPPGGPVKVAQRIGILLIVVAIVATLGIAGFAALRGHVSPNANGGNGGGSATPAPTATDTSSPTASPSGPSYFTFQDPANEFSISRPQGWIARGLATQDPNIPFIVGPDAPYPPADFVAVVIHPLPFVLRNSDLVAFKDFLVEQLSNEDNIITEEPSPYIDGHAGYLFTTSNPKSAPTTLHQTYYLIDGNRYISIILQIEPPTDSTALSNLAPIFQTMAQSFKSYHVSPTPTSTVTPAASATPTGTAKSP